jgi:hypothetical protein
MFMVSLSGESKNQDPRDKNQGNAKSKRPISKISEPLLVLGSSVLGTSGFAG